MIYIDVPQLAYKTWRLEYVVLDKDGNRDRLAEREAECDLKQALSAYQYSIKNDHVR